MKIARCCKQGCRGILSQFEGPCNWLRQFMNCNMKGTPCHPAKLPDNDDVPACCVATRSLMEVYVMHIMPGKSDDQRFFLIQFVLQCMLYTSASFVVKPFWWWQMSYGTFLSHCTPLPKNLQHCCLMMSVYSQFSKLWHLELLGWTQSWHYLRTIYFLKIILPNYSFA